MTPVVTGVVPPPASICRSKYDVGDSKIWYFWTEKILHKCFNGAKIIDTHTNTRIENCYLFIYFGCYRCCNNVRQCLSFVSTFFSHTYDICFGYFRSIFALSADDCGFFRIWISNQGRSRYTKIKCQTCNINYKVFLLLSKEKKEEISFCVSLRWQKEKRKRRFAFLPIFSQEKNSFVCLIY